MDNQVTYLVEDKFEEIAFVDIVMPYTKSFLYELEKINIIDKLLNKLHLSLLQRLSSVAEIVLQEELELFITVGQNYYDEFVVATNSSLMLKYPVLNEILKTIAKDYLEHIQNIFFRFYKDVDLIYRVFSVKVDANSIIENIDTSLGDGHSGESTALVVLCNGTKLIYKPRNVEITNSYNSFIDWVNHKLRTNLKTFKCISCESYGWLEFVAYKSVDTIDELQEYYYKAGTLLAVALLLGSKDCHYENIIASGGNPVLVDHETIIQPILSKQSIRTWDEEYKIPYFSVLESMLIVNQTTGVPSEHVGYGIKGNVEVVDIDKKIINPNTINSRRTARFTFRKLIKENIPFYKEIPIFAADYKDYFVKGFSDTYDMFMINRDELMSANSPILFFANQKVRYVWRPTFVYFRILKYMRGVSFMSGFEVYKSKLYELMSRAYMKGNLDNYKSILTREMKQMLNGDIPLFNLISLDYHLEEDKFTKIFEHNCIQNIQRRVSLMSVCHKKEQLNYIEKWLNM